MKHTVDHVYIYKGFSLLVYIFLLLFIIYVIIAIILNIIYINILINVVVCFSVYKVFNHFLFDYEFVDVLNNLY